MVSSNHAGLPVSGCRTRTCPNDHKLHDGHRQKAKLLLLMAHNTDERPADHATTRETRILLAARASLPVDGCSCTDLAVLFLLQSVGHRRLWQRSFRSAGFPEIETCGFGHDSHTLWDPEKTKAGSSPVTSQGDVITCKRRGRGGFRAARALRSSDRCATWYAAQIPGVKGQSREGGR